MSPTYDHIGGFMFYFVKADLEERPHAHVGEGKKPSGADGKIWLDTLTVQSRGRFNEHQMGRALRIATEHQAEWLEMWRKHAANR